MKTKHVLRLNADLKQALDGLDHLVLILDQDGVVQWLNHRADEACGNTPGKNLIGKSLKTALGLKKTSSSAKSPKQKQGIDTVTGLHHPGYLKNILQRYIKDEKVSQFALFYIDIDQFQRFNRQLGRQGADKVLRQVAEFMQKLTSQADTVVRMEDDEFAIVLLEPDSEEAIHEFAEQLQQQFDKFSVSIGKKQYSVDITIGCAIYPDDAMQASKLIELANTAMLLSKRMK